MREAIQKALREQALQLFGLGAGDLPAFTLEVPGQVSHGDFASNLAMVLGRKLKRSPRDIAVQLSQALSQAGVAERVEVAGPGFLNFFLRTDRWRDVLPEILAQGIRYGRSRAEAPEKVMVEFVSANPTGPLHFGHGRGAVVGDVVARLLDFTGHQVHREFYVNDAGAQVRNLALSVIFRLREMRGLPAELPPDGYKGDYVIALARALPPALAAFLPGAPTEPEIQAITQHVIRANLEQIQQVLHGFGVQMDQYSSERELLGGGRLQEAQAELRQKGVLEEHAGALWFLSDRFGDEKPRVLVKSDGSNTYFATDLAYHLDKLRRGYDRLINIWGADHHGYIPRMKAALQAFGHPADKLEVVLVQMVSLLRNGQPVVMSKRAGEITTLEEVVEEVGRDAARFFFLLRGVDSQMEFDLELAKKRTLDNPVFYVQYGHARLCSILRKAAERGIGVPAPADAANVDLRPLVLPEELQLIKKMASLGDVVRRAAESRAPHQMVFYLQDLVAEFHHYYSAYGRTQPILGGEPSRISSRLVLVLALRQVLQVVLALLGVSAPDRMDSPAGEEKEEG